MSTFQDEIKRDYVSSVTCLGCGQVQEDEILKKIDVLELEPYDIATAEDIAKVYRLYTRQLLQYHLSDKGEVIPRSYLNREISRDLQNAMVETFALKLWEYRYPQVDNPRRSQNPYWMEMQISDILIELMGYQRSFVTCVQSPGLFIERIRSIPYHDGNLLDYMNEHLTLAKQKPNRKGERICDSVEIMNCVEALSDCNRYLDLDLNYKIYQKL